MPQKRYLPLLSAVQSIDTPKGLPVSLLRLVSGRLERRLPESPRQTLQRGSRVRPGPMAASMHASEYRIQFFGVETGSPCEVSTDDMSRHRLVRNMLSGGGEDWDDGYDDDEYYYDEDEEYYEEEEAGKGPSHKGKRAGKTTTGGDGERRLRIPLLPMRTELLKDWNASSTASLSMEEEFLDGTTTLCMPRVTLSSKDLKRLPSPQRAPLGHIIYPSVSAVSVKETPEETPRDIDVGMERLVLKRNSPKEWNKQEEPKGRERPVVSLPVQFHQGKQFEVKSTAIPLANLARLGQQQTATTGLSSALASLQKVAAQHSEMRSSGSSLQKLPFASIPISASLPTPSPLLSFRAPSNATTPLPIASPVVTLPNAQNTPVISPSVHKSLPSEAKSRMYPTPKINHGLARPSAFASLLTAPRRRRS